MSQVQQRLSELQNEKQLLQSECDHKFSGNTHFIRCHICGRVEVLYY
ncbi:hypothetical protein [Shouchella lehensis]|nr:hypothetical protein [Shouchella lehensis]